MLKRLLGAVGLRGTSPALPPTDQSTTSARPVPVDVTDADFAERVLASEQLVVVDVWAEWCEPCQIMSAYMGFLAQEYAGRVLVSALDADTNPATTERYGILGLPTLLFFRGGVEVERQVGVVDYATLRGRIEQILAMDSPLIT